MADSIKLIFQLLYQPVAAMSAILDRGSLLYASLSVVAVSFALQSSTAHLVRLPFYGPLLALAVAYVPGILLLCSLFGRLAGFAVSFQRDYSPLLTCTAMAWSSANLALVVAGWIVPQQLLPVVAGLAYVYFAVLMFFAIRTVFGAGNGASSVDASTFPDGMDRVPVLPLLHLVLFQRRFFEFRRGHAEPPKLPSRTGSLHR
jgi:hypothetical protein